MATREQILKRYPNANERFIQRVLDADSAGAVAVVERPAVSAPLEAVEDKTGPTGRIFIRFVSVRKRLLDPDNLCEKYLLDCLRYSGLISGDEPEKVSLETAQRKCRKGESEKTIVEISKLDTKQPIKKP